MDHQINSSEDTIEIDSTSMEIKKQFMDSTRLKQATGWTPKNRFEEILPETVRWYLNHYDQK